MLTKEQKEQVIDAIESFKITDTIRINEYLGDLSKVNGYINYGDAYYISWWKPSVDCEFDNIILEVSPCGGHSGSGSVNKANHKVFVDEFGELDGVYTSEGGMGTYAVFIKPELLLNKEIYETLAVLTDYPVLDDMVHSEMQNEAQEEAWENWARSEFERSLECDLNLEDLDCEDEDLKKVFELGRSRSHEEWHEESDGSQYINVDAIAATITIKDLEENDIGFELMED